MYSLNHATREDLTQAISPGWSSICSYCNIDPDIIKSQVLVQTRYNCASALVSELCNKNFPTEDFKAACIRSGNRAVVNRFFSGSESNESTVSGSTTASSTTSYQKSMVSNTKTPSYFIVDTEYLKRHLATRQTKLKCKILDDALKIFEKERSPEKLVDEDLLPFTALAMKLSLDSVDLSLLDKNYDPEAELEGMYMSLVTKGCLCHVLGFETGKDMMDTFSGYSSTSSYTMFISTIFNGNKRSMYCHPKLGVGSFVRDLKESGLMRTEFLKWCRHDEVTRSYFKPVLVSFEDFRRGYYDAVTSNAPKSNTKLFFKSQKTKGPMKTWSIEETSAWLEDISPDLSEAFEGYNGQDLFDMDMEDVKMVLEGAKAYLNFKKLYIRAKNKV